MAFLTDVGLRPSPEYSVDRYPNNNGNYEPGNVRWATDLEQNRNRRPMKAITNFTDEEMLYEFARRGFDTSAIRQLLAP